MSYEYRKSKQTWDMSHRPRRKKKLYTDGILSIRNKLIDYWKVTFEWGHNAWIILEVSGVKLTRINKMRDDFSETSVIKFVVSSH